MAYTEPHTPCVRREGPRDILLLCQYCIGNAPTIVDHINAIADSNEYRVHILPMRGRLPDNIDLNQFDVIVVHYTLHLHMDTYICPISKKRIREFSGLKAVFIQDEYQFVNKTVNAIRDLGIHILFTCVPPEEIEKVYPESQLPGLKKVNVLTGYVPINESNEPVKPYTNRTVDVGYRGRVLPAWLGHLAQEKSLIAYRFLADAPAYNLNVDISVNESDRLYGPLWKDFLSNCKATLGVESGASVFDFSGEIQKNVEEHIGRDPDVTFNELRSLYFESQEGKIRLNQISPRFFEAAKYGTLMVLYEGDYSGVLEVWRHYIPLTRNHSNMKEVVAIINNPKKATEIIAAAKHEVADSCKYSYKALTQVFDQTLNYAIEKATYISRTEFDNSIFENIFHKQREQMMKRFPSSRPVTI